MAEQITDVIMMVRPSVFRLNTETAVNNYFQTTGRGVSLLESQQNALNEFDTFVEKLRSAEVEVLVFEDKAELDTPDSIFPNNWNSFHENGRVYLYPMFALNRRRERSDDILESIGEKFRINSVESFTKWEEKHKFLEGTGSLILDRPNKLAYAAISERTNPRVLKDFSERSGYEIVSFTSNQTVDGKRLPIYHTNVMMCIGEGFAIICADSIDDTKEKEHVLTELKASGKDIIEITEDQKDQFAGNMLQVRNKNDQRLIVMSDRAYNSLDSEQISKLKNHGKLLHSPIDMIEQLGGGGVRCMMAEIFLPRKSQEEN